MKGYIILEFDGNPSHYIKVEHITLVIDKNGYANLTLLNGDEFATNKKTADIIKAIKEQI